MKRFFAIISIICFIPSFLLAISLDEGWNLISSKESGNKSFDDFFAARNFSTQTQSFETVWGWDSSTNNWKLFVIDETLEDFNKRNSTNFQELTSIDPERGYWIKTTEAVEFNYTSDSQNTSENTESYSLNLVSISGGSFTMGEAEDSYQGPPGSYDATEHIVTLNDFQMSDTEVTNQQYVDFLNAAENDDLVEVQTATSPPDTGKSLVYGTNNAPDEYKNQALLNLDGTRVMKDHDNADDDNDPFTGVIEPENPLNIIYIGYDSSKEKGSRFYIKDPRSDFDWHTLTNYYNYSSISHEEDTDSGLLNDYDNWPELSDFPDNMPTKEDIRNWPVTFIRWYGAKAFALYYDYDLPTEAQWEYAAKGQENFVYATADGNVNGDGTSANWNYKQEDFSKGHVLDVKTNSPNPYGLYNMAGNVWEWVEDWYASDFYGSDPTVLATATDPRPG